jgi:hypothetical protein
LIFSQESEAQQIDPMYKLSRQAGSLEIQDADPEKSTTPQEQNLSVLQCLKEYFFFIIYCSANIGALLNSSSISFWSQRVNAPCTMEKLGDNA